MKFSAGCLKLPPIALGIAMISLGACVKGGSELGGRGCPPVVEYDAESQAQAADELLMLPNRSAAEELLADYEVLRAQARLCASH